MTRYSGFPEFAGMTCQFFNFPLPHSERCVIVIKYENLNKPASGQVAGYARLLAVPARHGGAQPSKCESAEQHACPPKMLRIAVSSLPSHKSGFIQFAATGNAPALPGLISAPATAAEFLSPHPTRHIPPRFHSVVAAVFPAAWADNRFDMAGR